MASLLLSHPSDTYQRMFRLKTVSTQLQRSKVIAPVVGLPIGVCPELARYLKATDILTWG